MIVVDMKSLSDHFATSIIHWQVKHGRHNLPWQQAGAYATWISEIMLQQTQVITVIDYYKRFMSAFPTIEALAAAPIDDVLSLWSGLGYYARARNLHKCANILVEKHLAQLPTNKEALMLLPGIGPSTAGAILALGHHQYGVILDGNVKRILARCFGMHMDIQNTQAMKSLWSLSTMTTPAKECATYTQGIMDLGASVCHKHNPDCGKCPIQNICYAYQHQVIKHLPYPRIKKLKPTFQKLMLIAYVNRKIGLIKQPNEGIWGGLWTPILNTERTCQTKHIIREYPVIKHIFTHQTWLITPILLNTAPTTIEHWFSLEDALQLGLPKPVKSILEVIQHDYDHTLQETT